MTALNTAMLDTARNGRVPFIKIAWKLFRVAVRFLLCFLCFSAFFAFVMRRENYDDEKITGFVMCQHSDGFEGMYDCREDFGEQTDPG